MSRRTTSPNVFDCVQPRSEKFLCMVINVGQTLHEKTCRREVEFVSRCAGISTAAARQDNKLSGLPHGCTVYAYIRILVPPRMHDLRRLTRMSMHRFAFVKPSVPASRDVSGWCRGEERRFLDTGSVPSLDICVAQSIDTHFVKVPARPIRDPRSR